MWTLICGIVGGVVGQFLVLLSLILFDLAWGISRKERESGGLHE